MAVVTVAWDAASFGRLNDADTTTNWTATGSGASPTVETDYYYQGAACISIQVKTSVYTLEYLHGTTTDMNTTPRVWMAKIIQTNKNAIDGNGFLLQIGNDTSNYYEYDVFDSNTYPTLGGFVIIPVDPSVSNWANNTVGTPNVAQIDWFRGVTDAAFTAKAPNFGIDAIDIMDRGTGLTLTRGDSTDANGTFQDFVDSDEGTANNRWGVIQTRDGILYVNGVLTIGNSTTNTEFTDSNKVIVFPESRTGNGFNGIDFGINNTSTIDISACVFTGRGSLAFTGVDTRPDYTALGTAGTLTVSDSTFNTFRHMTLTSNCVFDGCNFLSGQYIEANTANVFQCIITDAATAPGEAFIATDNVTRVVECSFTQGANGGHAVQCNTAGTYTWDNFLSGYSTSNGQTNSAFYNNSGGLITLNLATGADTPTVRNGAGATTDVVSSATITLSNMITNSEVRIIESANRRNVLAGTESTNSAVTAVSIVSGGTGYAVSDTLTITGGTFTTAAQLTVTSVNSGVITGVSIATPGNYTVDPSNPASHSGGTGSGATFNLTLRGSFAYNYGGSPIADIIVFHRDYKEVRFSSYTLPTSDSGLFISQSVDRVYLNP